MDLTLFHSTQRNAMRRASSGVRPLPPTDPHTAANRASYSAAWSPNNRWISSAVGVAM